MAAIDYFTKWPETFAIPNREAETVADVLVDNVFSRFGTAATINNQQGRNLESEVCRKYAPRHLTPRSTACWRGSTEPLACLTAHHQSDWNVHLPLILMTYQSAVQDSNAYTPALLMFDREVWTPAKRCSRDVSDSAWSGLHQQSAGPDGVCTNLCQGPAG